MKDVIRKELLTRRKKIIDKEKKSTVIVDKIINLDIYKKSKIVAIYHSMPDEVDTIKLIKDALENKTILLPKVFGNKMIFIKINKDTKYIKSTMGIMEPIGKEYSGNIDLIIVPGVAFDVNLNRLGFGKGYYDKYLSDKNIYKIGICFEEQMVSVLPIDNYDIKMNLIITENRVYK